MVEGDRENEEGRWGREKVGPHPSAARAEPYSMEHVKREK